MSPRPGSRPTVSVAMCTRNGEAFVRAQLTSILTQTVAVDEIVVSDDASSDATLVTVGEVLAEAAGVVGRVLRNASPIGVAANFAQAIGATTGDIVVLSDQDDVWVPGRVERLLAEFAARPGLQMVHSDARLVDGSGSTLGETLFQALGVSAVSLAAIHEGRAFEMLLRRNLVTGATSAFRRELAAIALPVPEGWIHDEWLAIVAAARNGLDVVEATLIDYRQHGGNEIGAASLGLKKTLGRLAENGAARNGRLVARARSLDTWMAAQADADPHRIAAANRKLGHELRRSALPVARVRRLGPVLAGLRDGSYREFGRGVADAVRDLVQPLSPSG